MASFDSLPEDTLVQNNIKLMNEITGFGVIIVCCSSEKQAQYWQQRLEDGKGSIIPTDTVVVATEEDWPGGAGNALGTLYAFSKAAAVALKTFKVDILSDLKEGKISVGLYHTAGKGTRLAPLPGAENNNKPGVKLPATTIVAGKSVPMTILEAVIKQTGCYARSRPGRLSVFWGDQIFIPTVPVEYTVTHHIDILCSLGAMVTEAVWKEKGMEKYGLIARSKNGEAAQVEKVDHATAVQLLASLGEIESVGASLGSFSISSFMLECLLGEFSAELASKTGKFDSDPHLWMPMTLEKSAYLHLMKQKGIAESVSSSHFERIATMMKTFNAGAGHLQLGLFGPVDVGQGVYWWDYGQLKLYLRNTLLVTERTREAELMRLFMGIPESSLVVDSNVANTDVDGTSVLFGSSVGSDSKPKGRIQNCVLNNVRCKYIDASNSILINITADRIVARGENIAYNIIDESVGTAAPLLDLTEKSVLVGVFNNLGEQCIIRSDMDTDGGKAWEKTLAGNSHSFEAVYNSNVDTCPSTLEKIISSSHDGVWGKL